MNLLAKNWKSFSGLISRSNVSVTENIQVLDCTLCDGDHVKDFLFGLKTISSTTEKAAHARVDIIETGFLHKVAFDQDKRLYDSLFRLNGLLPELKEHQCLSLVPNRI